MFDWHRLGFSQIPRAGFSQEVSFPGFCVQVVEGKQTAPAAPEHRESVECFLSPTLCQSKACRNREILNFIELQLGSESLALNVTFTKAVHFLIYQGVARTASL